MGRAWLRYVLLAVAVSGTGVSASAWGQASPDTKDELSVRTPMHAAAKSGFATYDEALDFAENSFAFGDYDRVIRVLEPWLMPSPIDSSTDGNIADGYGWLGASAWFEGRIADADTVFRTGLRQRHTMTLDPLVFPPELVHFFREIREEMQPELAQRHSSATDNIVYIESRVAQHPRWVSMLPFGYGMFVNGESEWGIVYAFTEVSLLTVSSTLFWVNYAQRTASDDPNHPLGYPDPRRAETRRRVHIGTGAAFIGVVVVNMIHGAIIHNRERQVQYRTLTGPPEGFDAAPGPSQRTRRWQIQVTPLLDLSNQPPHPRW